MKTRFILLGLLPLCLFSAAWAQERFRKNPPIPDPPPEIRLPAIETYVLSNGLTLAVVRRADVPFISLELVILAGESSSPENLPGLATFTAGMINRGTALLSASELEERIESIGGNFSTAVTLDISRFSLTFLREWLDQALESLSLMILQPDFAEREIVALKRTTYYEWLARQADPEFVGYRQLLRRLFQGHPWQKAFYNEEVFKNISRRDIQNFYETYYRPNNAVLVLAGNLTLVEAARKVSHFLNLWAEREIKRPSPPPPVPASEGRFCLVDFPAANDAFLFVGNLIFPNSDPDVFPFSVLSQILGGTPNSRLLLNLREAREFAYYAFSQLDLFRTSGVYSIRTKVIASACFSAAQEILKELERMAREKVSSFEVEQAKQFLIGRFPLELVRVESLARRVSEIVSFELGKPGWEGYSDQIMLVDPNRVFEVAQKYLLAKPVVVFVGNRDLLLDYLQDLDTLEVYDAKGALRFTLKKGGER